MTLLLAVASNVLLAVPLALAAGLAQRVARPGLARGLWLLVLVKLLTPPAVAVPLGPPPGPAACALGACACDGHPALAWPRVLLAAWAAGAGATAWVAWRRWARFRRLLAHASPAPAGWQALAADLSAGLALRRVPEVLTVPGRLPPLVVPGWRRPRLVLPADLLGRLTDAQRSALLLHELVHLRRGDHRARLLELAVGVAYWWLPGVRAAGRRLRACEERCCDAAVVDRLPAARREYAGLLLDVAEFAAPAPACATGMTTAEDLEQRLRAVLAPAPRRRSWPGRAAAAGLACAVLPCGVRVEAAGRAAVDVSAPPADEACVAGADRVLSRSLACCPR